MGENSIPRRIKVLLAAAALTVVMAFGAALPVFAANAPPGCEKDRGTIECEETGKNQNQPKFEQTTLKKGSTNSSHEEETVCNKPCPPGQFN